MVANPGLSGIVKTPFDFGATANASSDDTTAVQKWLDWAASGTPGLAALPPYTFNVKPVKGHGRTSILGMGMRSVLKAIPGSYPAGGALLSLDNVANSQGVVMRDFMVDGNGQNLTNIYLNNSNLHMDPNDALHRLTNIWSMNAGIDAFGLGAAVIETVLQDCYAFNAFRYGYFSEVGATDNRFLGCTAGACRSDGFRIVGNNVTLTACKSFYSGYNRQTIKWAPAHGFNLRPDSNQQLRMVGLLGCEAQNNALNGFNIDGGADGVTNSTVQHVTMSGCLADGNNELLQGGVGVYLRKALNCQVTGTVTNLQDPAAHDYALSLNGDLSGTVIGSNDWSGGKLAPMFVNPNAFGHTHVATDNGGVAPVVVPADTVLGTGQGLDAPKGFNAMRMVNQAPGGQLQLVAPTAGGGIGLYAGTANIANFDEKRARVLRTLNLASTAPASSTAPGEKGDMAWDASYMYVCTATNVWKRSPLGTW